MKIAEEITNLVLVKITATWVGDSKYFKDGSEVIFLEPREDWRKTNAVWIFRNGSQNCDLLPHVEYDNRLTNVRYEFKEVK